MCFSKGCACPDDNLSDPIQNGRLINDLLNVAIFLSAENVKTHVSRKRSEIERFRRNFSPTGYLCGVSILIFKKILSRQIWRPF